MSVRHLAAAVGVTAIAAACVALPAAAANAAAPSDVYVEAPAAGGDDANFPTCSQADPCATMPAAMFAVADGGTIHVGAGTFDGELRPGALNGAAGLSVNIEGQGSGVGGTKLTADSSGDGYVLEVSAGTTALSDLSIEGGLFVDVLVDGGTVTTDRVVLGESGCNLLVQSGSATLADSTVRDGGQPGCPSINIPPAEISVTGGSVSLVRSRVLAADTSTPGVAVSGGTFTADQSFFDDSAHDLDTNNSNGVKVTGGTATLRHSTFHGWGSSGVRNVGGTALVTDSTFEGNVVGVTGDAGATTVVRSTFERELASLQGTVSVAGSLLGSMLGAPTIGIQECAPNGGTITDLGYNLSSDASCGFTGTSQDDVTGLNLDTALADRGGPVQTVATFWPSPAVDSIPAGATYGGSATPLCAGTDLRGVPRPQGGACDAGSMELVGTTTTLTAPTTAKPHTDVPLVATVAVPEVAGVEGIESANGTVTFTVGASTVLCQDVLVHLGEAACTTDALGAGSQTVRATFTPTVDASTLHASTMTRTIKVGTTPAFTSKSKATFVVGKSTTFRVRASGSPSPRVTLVKGKLPAGLRFRAGTGSATISGKAKASAVGSRSVTVQATNLRGSVRQVLKIVVSRH